MEASRRGQIIDLGEAMRPKPGNVDGHGGSKVDPSSEIRGMPPNYGDWMMPHVVSFQGVVSSISRVYRPSDEALRHSYENARFMINDPMITECLEHRMRSMALLNWHIEPEDNRNTTHKWLAEQLTAILKKTPRFMQYRENLGRAIWYGRYGCQHKFAWKNVRDKQRVTIGDWKPVNGDKIVFRYDDGTNEYDPNQVGIRVGAGYTMGDTIGKRWKVESVRKVEPTDYGLAYFLEPWERNLIAIHRHMIEDGEYEDPQSAGRIHGVGIRSRIYWLWYQKQELTAFLIDFLERCSTGIELWYYPWGNETAREKMKQAAEERIGDGRNVILVPRPEDQPHMYGVDRIEPSMGGAEVLLTIIKTLFGEQIKRYILGQTSTTEANATGIGSNLPTIHLDTWLQIVKYDCINLEETITTDVVVPLQRFNFPKLANVPLYFRIDTESADVDAKLQGYQAAFQMGLKLKAAEIYDLIGASKPEPTDEVISQQSMQQSMQQAGAMGGMPGMPGMPEGGNPMEAAGGMPGEEPEPVNDEPVPLGKEDQRDMQDYAAQRPGDSERKRLARYAKGHEAEEADGKLPPLLTPALIEELTAEIEALDFQDAAA